MTNIIITGSNGRMGEALSRCATHHAGLNVVGTIDMGDDLGSIIDQGDVIIDFSFHEVTLPFASLCAERNKGLVIGTTGHSEEDRMAILELTSRIPIVWASNYSTGVNTLFWLTRKATEILGTDFDLEVVEMHHRMKRDAPSGTAMTLAEILSEARDVSLQDQLKHGRECIVDSRKKLKLACIPFEVGMSWETTPSSMPMTVNALNSLTRPPAATLLPMELSGLPRGS